jgi:uncharacterized protein (DUF3084 family)
MKKALFLSVFSALLMPQVVFGAWWNFWKKQPANVVEPMTINAPIGGTTTTREVIIEKPVEKIVTKIVDSSALQARIDELSAENKLLKNRITQIESEKEAFKTELTKLRSILLESHTTVSKPKLSIACQNINEEMNDSKSHIDTLLVEQERQLAKINSYNTTSENIQSQTSQVKAETKTKVDTITKEVARLQAQFDVICK